MPLKKAFGARLLVKSLANALALPLAVPSIGPLDEDTFNIVIKTDNIGTSTNTQFTLPLDGVSTYNFDIDWGDNTSETIMVNTPITHEYGTAGTYAIRIGGNLNTFPAMTFNNGGDKAKVAAITSWGLIAWAKFTNAFYGCENLVFVSDGAINTAAVTDYANAFRDCSMASTIDITNWNTSAATTFDSMFRGCTALSTLAVAGLDVSSVQNMRSFVRDCTSLGTVPVASWITSGLTDLGGFGLGASILNVDFSTFNWSLVTNAANLMDSPAYTTANYDALLISLSTQTLQPSVALGVGGVCYSAGAPTTAKNDIVVNDLWTISDGGSCNNESYWLGTTSADWGTASNWLDNSVPGNTDVAIFESANNNPCNINIGADVQGVDIKSGYTNTITQNTLITIDVGSASWLQNDGVFVGGDSPITMNGSFNKFAGIFTSTSGLLSVKNNWNKQGGIFNHNNGQVDFSLIGPQNYESTTIDEFYIFRIAKGLWDLAVIDQHPTVSSRLIIDNSSNSSSPALSGRISLIGNAVLEQNGNLYDNIPGGEISFDGVNHEWIQNNTNQRAQLPIVTVNCADLKLTVGTVGNTFGMWKLRWLAGTITNSETSDFRNNQQGRHVTFALYLPLTIRNLSVNPGNFDFTVSDAAETGAQTLTVSDLDFGGVQSGTQLLLGTIDVHGNYSQNGLSVQQSSSGSIRFVGTGIQTVDLSGSHQRIPALNIEIDKPSGTVQLLTNIKQSDALYSIIHTNGILDLNGFDIATGKDLTFNADLADMAGSVVTVGGNFDANNATIEGTADYTLDVAGTNTATTCVIGHCDASGGVALTATTSTDNGNNTNVNFV